MTDDINPGGAESGAPEAAIEAGTSGPEQSAPEYRLPSSWSSKGDLFNSLSPEDKKFVIDREEALHRGLAQYKDGHTRWGQISERIKDYMPMLQARGVTVEDSIPQLMAATNILYNGTPQQKAGLIRTWIDHFGIDLSSEQQQDDVMDDGTARTSQELRELRDQLHLSNQQVRDLATQFYKKDLDAFVADPKNKHFDRVAPDIQKLLRAGYDLKSAYETAIWSNPETRKELLAQQQESPRDVVTAAARAAASATRTSKGPAPLPHSPKATTRDRVTAAANQLGIK